MARRTLLALAAAALAVACSPKAPAASEPLRFSVLSTETSSAEQAKWAPFLADLSKRIGREVKPFYAASYAPLVEALRFKQTDAGWFSNQPGLEAVRRAGGEVFASTTHPDGSRGYHSVIVVKRGSGLTLERLLKCDRTLNFGMGDPKSTSGTLAPRAWLFAPRGLDPQSCFKTLRSASHEANLLAVANGVVDAAANNTNDLERLVRRHDPAAQAVLDKVQVVWTSPTLPEDPVIWRRDLDAPTKARLRNALLSYGVGTGSEAERQRKVLADLNFGPFQPADDRHLLPVRELEAGDALVTARRTGDAAGVKRWTAELDAVRAQEKAPG